MKQVIFEKYRQTTEVKIFSTIVKQPSCCKQSEDNISSGGFNEIHPLQSWCIHNSVIVASTQGRYRQASKKGYYAAVKAFIISSCEDTPQKSTTKAIKKKI